MLEQAPLCDHCRLRESCSTTPELLTARDKAAEYYYDNIGLEISDIPGFLIDDEGVDPEDAELAVECLNKIYRNNCPTAVIGHIGANALGVVPRET